MELAVPVGARATRKADRRRAILDLAEREFLQHGYVATAMSTIATELGGSKTTLWSYFPSKEALFTAVVDRMIDGFSQALDAALIPAGGTAAALTRFGETFLHKLLSARSVALHRLIMTEAQRMPSVGEAFAARGPDRVHDRLSRYLDEEMAAGRLRQGDPLLAAKQFIVLCQARFYLDRLWRPWMLTSLDPADDIAVAVDSFMAAWGPR